MYLLSATLLGPRDSIVDGEVFADLLMAQAAQDNEIQHVRAHGSPGRIVAIVYTAKLDDQPVLDAVNNAVQSSPLLTGWTLQ